MCLPRNAEYKSVMSSSEVEMFSGDQDTDDSSQWRRVTEDSAAGDAGEGREIGVPLNRHPSNR